MAKTRCVTCREHKSAQFFPRVGATTCSACERAAIAADQAAVAKQQEMREICEEMFVAPSLNSDIFKELGQRELARRSLIHFIQRFKPAYLAGWVHKDICRRLERFMQRVENKESPRMIIMAPVRHGKSDIGSRHFAPWVLGHHPQWEIISASSGQDLAITFSRYVRDLVSSEEYGVLFPDTVLNQRSQSVENWLTTKGGGYKAAGIGTTIVGRGAEILLIDDPIASGQIADSQSARDAVWEWFISTALNRLAPGGGVLAIMTHWNEDDFAGRVQKMSESDDDQADKYEIVKYPAINTEGDEYLLRDDMIVQIPAGDVVPEGASLTRVLNTPLHPERYTYKMLMNSRATYYVHGNQRWWYALYQQSPIVEEGVFFTKSMFQLGTDPPDRSVCDFYQGWDFSITMRDKSDWSVGVTLAYDRFANLHVIDVNRFKSNEGEDIVTRMILYNNLYPKARIAIEDGVIFKSLASSFTRICENMNARPEYEMMPTISDKKARAQATRGLMQQRRLIFYPNLPYFNSLQQEMLRFLSGGKHDDQVDALAHAVNLALSRSPPQEAQSQNSRGTKSWKDRISGMLGNNNFLNPMMG